MKNALFFLPALCLVALVSITGCDQDPCQSIQCGNGSCNVVDGEASCTCSSGYERDANGECTVTWREKFLGTYSCTEIRIRDGILPADTLPPYPITVKTGGSSYRTLIFSGLGGSNEFCTVGKLEVQARLDSLTEFTLTTPQAYCPNDPDVASSSIEGDGKYVDGEIRIEYKYAFDNASNAHSYVCKAILRK